MSAHVAGRSGLRSAACLSICLFVAAGCAFLAAGCASKPERESRSSSSAAGVALVDLYRDAFSEQWGYHCDFDPSCSEFGRQAIERYGLIAGSLMTADRLMRDHPLSLSEYARTAERRPHDPVDDNALFAAYHVAGDSSDSAEEDDEPVGAALQAKLSGSSEELFQFAERLFLEGDVERARIEFRRYRFLHPNGERGDAALERIVVCLSRLGRFDEALSVVKTLPEGEERDLVEALVLRDAGRLDEARRILESDSRRSDEARILAGFLRLENGDSARARAEFSALPDEIARPLLERCDRFDELPTKSPVAAGLLSAALPGSGQAYSERYADGIIAFVINGLLIGGTVAAALEEEEVTAAVVGTVALGFYTGNVYGGVNAAERFNRRGRDDFLSRARGFVRQNSSAWGIGITPSASGGAISVYFDF